MLGTFIKSPSAHIVEIMGTTALDFAVIDAEHAPFDRRAIDQLLLAGRATGLPLLVRIPDDTSSTILSVLDLGAAGILVPHVDTAEQAREIVSRAKFRGGSRGYSSSPRFASYGKAGMAAAIETGDRAVVLCQIESEDGLRNAADIARVPGVDGLFIGRADLSLSMNVDVKSEAIFDATSQIISAARNGNILASMFVGSAEEIPSFSEQGVKLFVVSSDQSLLRLAIDGVASTLALLKPEFDKEEK